VGFIEAFGRTCVSVPVIDARSRYNNLCLSVKVAPSIATSFFTYELVGRVSLFEREIAHDAQVKDYLLSR
jgi:hypothetical protein